MSLIGVASHVGFKLKISELSTSKSGFEIDCMKMAKNVKLDANEYSIITQNIFH